VPGHPPLPRQGPNAADRGAHHSSTRGTDIEDFVTRPCPPPRDDLLGNDGAFIHPLGEVADTSSSIVTYDLRTESRYAARGRSASALASRAVYNRHANILAAHAAFDSLARFRHVTLQVAAMIGSKGITHEANFV